MKSLNHNISKWFWNIIKVLAIIAAIYGAGILLFGCNPAKQQQRQDEKAVRRVKANIDLLNQVGESI